MEVIKQYTVRPLEEKDLHIILDWRNSDKVHSQMLTDHKITWDEHYGWFQRMKEQTVKRNLVFEYQGEPIGYIGYTEYDEENHTCSPGAYLGAVENLPPEAALCLFYVSVDYPFNHLGMVQLNTDVFSDNTRALKLDTLLGYDIVREQDHYVTKNGVERLTYRLIITKEKWNKQKEKVSKYFPFLKNFIYV